ncbi:hypothetical protein [Sorangium sp. So ce131]|uniref:hypothetical protein n=1 Tax=Sorangium sp. So ce131 TaxID=3133282 RepID=UPI003F5DDF3C
MKHAAASLLLPALLIADPALADGNAVPELQVAGAATPSVGSDIRGIPNLFDSEFAAARLTFAQPNKTTATLSVAPLLTPGLYGPWWSETRLGLLVEDSGSFAVGASWGYNLARARLAADKLPEATPEEKAPRESVEQQVDASIRPLVSALCARLDECSKAAPRSALCVATAETDAACKAMSAGALGAKPKELYDNSKLPDAPAGLSGPDLALYSEIAQLREQIHKLIDERKSRVEAEALKAARSAVAKFQRERLERAYTYSFGFHVLGAVGFFPRVSAPPIAETSGGEPEDAHAQAIRNLDVALAARLNLSRSVLLQARGGYRKVRADAFESTELAGQGYGALDAAFFVPFDSAPDDKGFQAGLGFGLSLTYYDCAAAGGCSTELGISGYPAKLPLDWRTQATGFIELRMIKELQFRLGVEGFIEQVNGTIEGTAPDVRSPTLRGIRPTLSVGSAFWGI